jgi:hypothetical protein
MLAPHHQPLFDLDSSVQSLISGLTSVGFNDPDFRNSSYMRLNVIMDLISKGIIDENLVLKK